MAPYIIRADIPLPLLNARGNRASRQDTPSVQFSVRSWFFSFGEYSIIHVTLHVLISSRSIYLFITHSFIQATASICSHSHVLWEWVGLGWVELGWTWRS